VTRLWCELAWLGGERAEPGVLVEVDGERIARVETGASEAGNSERLAGLTIPGLANAHSHAFQRALRGRTQAGTGNFWTWREQMYELAQRMNPDSCFAISRACFGEMALAGVTCVGEFHYLHGEGMEEAVIAAAREAGIRITLLDACYLHGGIERFRDADAHAWAERVSELEEGAAVRIGAAIHSVRAVDPESARVVADWAAGRPLHAHVSEQPGENEECLERHGMTPTALLADAGALSERFTAVHATHLTEEDVRLLGGAAATCCLCPTTERDLADGIGRASMLRDAGARLAVGSDSHAVIDLLEEARAIELDERLATGVRGLHRASDLLTAATAHGHGSLGWPEAGRIEAGALADLATISLDGVRMAGTTRENAVESAVFAATADDVTEVMVGGRWVVRDGAHVSLDVAGELARAIE
jgi:formiminoglutamate deiminase